MSTTTITPEVGKHHVTLGGWITPPYDPNNLYPAGFHESLISEYVDPSAVMYRRDLEAQLYVETTSILLARDNIKFVPKDVAKKCIIAAAALIEAQEEAK